MTPQPQTSFSAPRWTPGRIQRHIRKLGPWFHNMQLGGIWTAPDHFLGDYPSVKWQRFATAIPTDLRGASVLDIGCNGGFYSIEMKKRGAARVLGVDHDPQYLAQARFAAQVNGLEIDFRKLSVYDLANLREKFDLVLFMGVLYHLRHPLLALDLIHEHVMAAGSQMVFQSMLRGSEQVESVARDYPFAQQKHFDAPGYPKLHFIENSYCNDTTNWWVPNRACVEAMLRSAGFGVVSHPEQEVYVCRWERLAGHPGGARAVYPATGKGRQ